MMKPKKLVLVLLVAAVVEVEMSQDVMKTLTINFAKPFEVCKKEMDLPDSVLKEFGNFWKEGYVLKDRNIGCAIMCISAKLELSDSDYNIHHGNAHEFAKKHGADDAMAKQLVDIIHGCMKSTPEDPDGCTRIMNVAQCFKDKIHELNWAPNPDLIVAELLAET